MKRGAPLSRAHPKGGRSDLIGKTASLIFNLLAEAQDNLI